MTYEAELHSIISSMVNGLRKIASSKKLLADFIDLESRRIAKAATDLLAAFDDVFLNRRLAQSRPFRDGSSEPEISLDKMHRAMIPFGNSGTELPKNGTGRGATVKTRQAKASVACGKEASKKKNSGESRLVSEARPFRAEQFTTLANMVQLAKKHSDIEEADKRRSLEHALASQRKDLLRILQVLNVKAQVAIEEMTEKEIPFPENAKLGRLAKLSYEDLLNSLLDDTHPLD